MRTDVRSAFVRTFFVATLLSSFPGVARSGDSETSPAERARAVLASLPQPSQKQAFRAEFELVIGGSVLGSGVFQATVTEIDKSPAWKAETSLDLAMGGLMKVASEEVATLGRDLRLLRSDTKKSVNGVATTTTIVRTKSGLTVTKTGTADAIVKEIAADSGTVGTMVAVLIFLRSVPAGAAKYELRWYSPKVGESGRYRGGGA